MTLTLLRWISQICWRPPLSLDFCDISRTLDWDYIVWDGFHWDSASSWHHIRGTWYQHDLSVAMLTWVSWFGWYLLDSLRCKVPLFPFTYSVFWKWVTQSSLYTRRGGGGVGTNSARLPGEGRSYSNCLKSCEEDLFCFPSSGILKVRFHEVAWELVESG